MRRLLLPLFFCCALAAPALAAGSAADSGKDKKDGGHKVAMSESYLMIEPIYTSIVDGDRPVGLLMVGIGLDVPNAGLRGKVTETMPRLRDAYIRNLMSFTTTSVRAWRQPDVAEIADRLQRVTDRVLQHKGARVLLAQVAIHLNK
jgi:flagellar basal body-associated protein FliL